MPYIPHEARVRMLEGIIGGVGVPKTAGELNWMITGRCREYLGPHPRYKDFNEVIGVLECVKMEFYRRMVAPYEDRKKEINGDVYK